MKLGTDTRALVTGASRGIGRSLAVELAARGATVGLLARNSGELETLAGEVRAGGGQAVSLPADVAERAEVEAAVRRFAESAGGLNLLVANAGVAWYGPLREMPVEEAERMTRVNWLGTVYTVTAALPVLLDQADGHIVVVSSAAGHRVFPWATVYGATKFAQRGFLEALRHELSGTGVGVTGVYPGSVATHLHDENTAHDRMPDWHHPDRAIAPERVAKATLRAVERGERAVFEPPITRLMSILHGVSPALADRLLRVVVGGTAAPAR